MKDSPKFGWKHILALLFGIAITVLVIIYANRIRDYEEIGYIGIFLLTLLGNATVLVPVPVLAPLNIVLGGVLTHPLMLGLIIGVASSIGEIVGYLVGYAGNEIVTSSKVYKKMEARIKKYGLGTIFFLALIPNPLFDVAGLVAGAIGIKWWKFLLAMGAGKIVRAIIFSYIGYGGKEIISQISLLPLA
jgi:membrane protein YqaA with SNARE-associated domain